MSEKQPVLFDMGHPDFPPAVRHADPDTSKAAAVRVKKNKRSDTDRTRCLAALRVAGERGLTDFELAEIVSRQQTSAGKRRGELEKMGLVRNSGRKRPAPSGYLAIVWQAV